MFGRLKISTKILFVTILISITIISVSGIISDVSTRGAFETEAFNKLTAVREMKGQQIEEYFDIISQQIRSLSQSNNAIEGMKDLKSGINSLSSGIYPHADRKLRLQDFYKTAFNREYQMNFGGTISDNAIDGLFEIDEMAQFLQFAYIVENKHPIGQKNKLLHASDGIYYNGMHRKYHPFFNQYLEKFGFYDIFLIDNADGRIIYSVFKEIDFGTSLLTGPYKETNLARAFNAARVSTDPDFVAVVDFEPYTPSYGAPAAFMASPIINRGNIIGVLAFQMPVNQINDIMTSKQAWKDVGLGLSGETYLVGADKLLRNQSRFLIEDRKNYLETIREIGTPEETVQKIRNLNSTIGLQVVDTEGTRAALAGESNTRIFPDYRGASVLSSYRPLKLLGLDWVIMSEIDEAEAFQLFDNLRDRMIMLASVLLALTIYISYYFSLSLTRPLRFLEKSAHSLSEGRLDEPIERSSNDEIGDLALSFETMRVALKDTFAEIEQQKDELEDRVRDRTAELDAVLENIDYGILLMDNDLKSRMINRAFRDMWMVPDEFADSNPTMSELMWSHLPKGYYDFVPRREFDEYVSSRTAAIQAGAVPAGVMDRSDGRAIQFQGVVLPDGGRMITYFDITEMKRKEEELEAASEKLQVALAGMLDGIYIIDGDLNFVAFNQRFVDLLEFPEGLVREGGSIAEVTRFAAQRGDYGDQFGGDIDDIVVNRLAQLTSRKESVIENISPAGRIIEYRGSPIKGGGLVTILHDITERKKAERELAEKEAQLRLAFDNMPAGIKFIDKDLKVIAFNSQYMEVMGYPDDLLREGGSSLDELKYQAERGDLGSGNPDALVEKALSKHGSNKTVLIEREVVDGRFVAITVQNTPDGQRVTVVHDITERKKAEQTMHEVYQIFDQMPMNVFVRDVEGRFRYINHAYETFHKVKNEDIVGKTLLEVFPEQGILFGQNDEDVIKNGDLYSTEENMKTDSGSVTFSVTKFPISDLDGNRIAVAGLDLDISERKEAEEIIRRRAMEASLLHRATQLAAESDAFDKSLQQCVDLVCDLIGWPVGHVYLPSEDDVPELISASIWSIANNKKYSEFKKVTAKTRFKMGKGLPGRIWKTGEPVWISDVAKDKNFPRKDMCENLNLHGAFGFPIEIRDEVVAVLEFFSDEVRPVDERLMETMAIVGIQVGQVLERKRIADELSEAKDAADEANRTKSAFLANMSHELRTPMNAILGFAEMLAEDAEDEGNEDQLADIKEIIDSGEHLLSLLNDVLDISKIEAGRMDLYLETFDLTTMMSEVASTTKALVDKNKNTMEVSIADDLGEMHADVTKVRQVLFNLMSNAAKFTSDGTITLFGERQAESGGDIIRLGVTDTGIGIPEDKLDRIFDEFSQADDSTTKNFGGTGLGLALVRRFCQMMGGDVFVESTMGEGSSFILELPATVVEQEGGPAEDQVEKTGEPSREKTTIPGSGSVLVIDDDRSARELIKRSLESEGHSVTIAEGGDEGIVLARSIKPSLITLDVLMPGRDGWSVLQELKSDPDLRDIPVVMVSMIDDNKMGSALGAVDHLSKPVDRNKLKALVKRYANKGRALVVEDEDAAREVVARALVSIGWKAVEAENGAVGIEKFGDGDFDLIILDIMMPVMDGFGFIKELRLTQKGRSVPVVVLTSKDLTKAELKELNGNVEEIFLKEETNIEELILEISNQLSSRV
jgi:PAS domain S-box-containing protein